MWTFFTFTILICIRGEGEERHIEKSDLDPSSLESETDAQCLTFRREGSLILNVVPSACCLCCNEHQAHWYSGNALDLYSEGARLKSQLGHWLSCLRFFVVSLSPSTKILDYYPD
jgi:hypothetical protein